MHNNKTYQISNHLKEFECHTWMNLDDNQVISIGYFNLKIQYHMGRLFTGFQKFNNQLIDYQ